MKGFLGRIEKRRNKEIVETEIIQNTIEYLEERQAQLERRVVLLEKEAGIYEAAAIYARARS